MSIIKVAFEHVIEKLVGLSRKLHIAYVLVCFCKRCLIWDANAKIRQFSEIMHDSKSENSRNISLAINVVLRNTLSHGSC